MKTEQFVDLTSEDADRYYHGTFIRARDKTKSTNLFKWYNVVGFDGHSAARIGLKGSVGAEAITSFLKDDKVEFDVSFPEIGLYNSHGTVFDFRRIPQRSTTKGLCSSTGFATNILFVPGMAIAPAQIEGIAFTTLSQVRSFFSPDKLLGDWENCYHNVVGFKQLAAAYSREYAIGASMIGRHPWLFRKRHPIGNIPNVNVIEITDKNFLQEARDTFETMGLRVLEAA